MTILPRSAIRTPLHGFVLPKSFLQLYRRGSASRRYLKASISPFHSVVYHYLQNAPHMSLRHSARSRTRSDFPDRSAAAEHSVYPDSAGSALIGSLLQELEAGLSALLPSSLAFFLVLSRFYVALQAHQSPRHRIRTSYASRSH